MRTYWMGRVAAVFARGKVLNGGLPVKKFSRISVLGRVALIVVAGQLAWVSPASGELPQPVVAVHVSELTRALESMPAVLPTPMGPGTTGFQWWTPAWRYHVMHESLREALRSDGTPFVEIGDSDITSGRLINSDGTPRYPIVFSLASEAVRDDEVAPLRSYVAGGGMLFVGSSAFTRRPDGTSRGDFALANEMGIHMTAPRLDNWVESTTFTKVANHRLVAHIQTGTLLWQMPLNSEEIPWGDVLARTQNTRHYLWSVAASDAQVIANGTTCPILAVKQYGRGQFIYEGAMQPLIGHGGMDSSTYWYGVFRNAIVWAFEAANAPIVRVSPWRFPYDAAFVVRHDFENWSDSISAIEASAQAEYAMGAKGDYFFCTGQLRVNMGEPSAVVNGLRHAVQNYGATIGSHNGGLQNPVLNLDLADYAHWHWGPDEALNTHPAGYASGADYAVASIAGSFQDIDRWLAGIGQAHHIWVSPFFNATREGSFAVLEQAGANTVGEQKIGWLPHWTVSLATEGKRYAHVTLPALEWYVGYSVAQAVEEYDPNALHACVDYFYGLGGLINIYSHGLSTSSLENEYVRYTVAKPRIWAANASLVYDWWVARSPVTISVSYAAGNGSSTAVANVSGATDPDTAIEMVIPGLDSGQVSIQQILRDGVATSQSDYRVNKAVVRIRVGGDHRNVVVQYGDGTSVPQPVASADSYAVAAGTSLSVQAPGVLSNDTAASGRGLQAVLISGPFHGSLFLNADGSFTYTPESGFSGADRFTYKANDGYQDSNEATATVSVAPVGLLYRDDFTRSTDPAPVSPWTVGEGTWKISGGALQGTSDIGSYGSVYIGNAWDDYAIKGQVQFTAGAFGGGLGGRFNPQTGAHYAAWVYPESLSGGVGVVRLVKFYDWIGFGIMQQVSVPSIGTRWHSLELAFEGNQIAVTLDGSVIIDFADNSYGRVPAYLSGGVIAELWTTTASSAMAVDNVTVSQPLTGPVAYNDTYSVVAGVSLVVAAPGVLVNDSAPGNGGLTATLVDAPEHGFVNLNANGSFTYTAVRGFSGSDSFTYRANYGGQSSATATVTFTVTAPQPPVAIADAYSIAAGATLTIAAPGVLTNDTAPGGGKLTAVLVAGGAHGMVNLSADGSFAYTPVLGFSGTDTFTYKVNDGALDSTTAAVTISITAPQLPVAGDDSYTVPSGGKLTIAAPGLLGNDTAPGGGKLSAIWVSGPAHGIVHLNADGSFTYISGTAFSGLDKFIYKVNDGKFDSAAATVTINVTPAGTFNDDFTRTSIYPWVAASGVWTIADGVLAGTSLPGTYGNLYLNGNWTNYSVQGQVRFAAGSFGGGLGGRMNPITGAHYAAWLYPEGAGGQSAILRLVKFQNWVGFTVMQQATIPAVGTNWHLLKISFQTNQISATVDSNVVVSATDPAPFISGGLSAEVWTVSGNTSMFVDNISVFDQLTRPVAKNDSYSVRPNAPMNVAAPGVLANDLAAAARTLSAILLLEPAHGTIKLASDGSFIYTPVTGFSGTDTFAYKVTDGIAASDAARVTLTVLSPGAF